jgi:hypothetical protein
VERGGASLQLDDQVGRESYGRRGASSRLELDTFLCGAVLSIMLIVTHRYSYAHEVAP